MALSTAKSFILTRQQIKNYPTFGSSKMNRSIFEKITDDVFHEYLFQTELVE